jgi:hypothetical protein
MACNVYRHVEAFQPERTFGSLQCYHSCLKLVTSNCSCRRLEVLLLINSWVRLTLILILSKVETPRTLQPRCC